VPPDCNDEDAIWEDIQTWLTEYYEQGIKALAIFASPPILSVRTQEDYLRIVARYPKYENASEERQTEMRYDVFMKETWLDLLSGLPIELRTEHIAFRLRSLESVLGPRIKRHVLSPLLLRKGFGWTGGNGKVNGQTARLWYYPLAKLNIKDRPPTADLLERMRTNVLVFKPKGRPRVRKPLANPFDDAKAAVVSPFASGGGSEPN
jgi:hypothetical protein